MSFEKPTGFEGGRILVARSPSRPTRTSWFMPGRVLIFETMLNRGQ